MEDPQFRQILDRFGFSWTGFRRVRKGVKKRLAHHMQDTGCRTIEDYIETIEMDRNVRVPFERLMTVSISRFFRDRGIWENLQGRILPMMVEKTRRPLKVWSAGCASGEEVYTFKILWEGLRESHTRVPELYVLATDMNPEYLERAKTAVYPCSSMREVPEAIRSLCFEPMHGGRFALKPRFKAGIAWQVHHLLSDPPGTAFDLIFLRNNLLTYYTDEVKIPAVRKVVGALAPGGFLVIGSHESLPITFAALKHWEDRAFIFQRQP